MKEQRKYLTEEELKRFLKGILTCLGRPAGRGSRKPVKMAKLSDWERKAQRQSRRAELSEAVYGATKGSRRGGVRGQGGTGTLSKLNEARKRQENAVPAEPSARYSSSEPPEAVENEQKRSKR